MNNFNVVLKNITETLGVGPQTSTSSTTTPQPAANTAAPNPSTTNNTNTAAPQTKPSNNKIDQNHPVIKELVAAKDPVQVLSSLKKLGVNI